MQPLQYYFEAPAAKDNSITHAAVVPRNLDAATTMRFAPRAQEQPLFAEHRGGTNRVRNDPSRTHEVPFTAGCNHFTRKNARFRAPASSPTQAPCHIHAAITMRVAAHANLRISTHMATSDDNNQPAIPLRSATTDSRHAYRTKHTGTTTRHRTQRRNPSRPERPQPHPPHTRGTFHRSLQPLYTEKYKVSCSGFLPNTSPMQHSRGHYNAFCRIVLQTCTYQRTWQHQMTTINQPFH